MSSVCIREGQIRQRGAGITVFLTIVYLTLIVFTCSLVEVTRINIAAIQAERGLISASQSVLGGYDNYLKEHYGIFARNEKYGDVAYMNSEPLTDGMLIEEDFSYYINSHIKNDPANSNQSLIDTYVLQKNDKPWHLTDVTLNNVSYTKEEGLFNPELELEESIAYIKNDILGYMEVRAPALFLEGLAEQFGAFEKVGKTGSFIQEKNAVIESAGSIQEEYEKLYTLIEGIVINKDNGQIEVLDQNYVKRIQSQTKLGKEYQVGYIEQEIYDGQYNVYYPLTNKLNEQLVSYGDLIASYKSNLSKFMALAPNLSTYYEKYNQIVDEIAIKEGEILPLESAVTALINKGSEIEAAMLEAEANKDATSAASYQDDLLDLSKKIGTLHEAIREIETKISDLKIDKAYNESAIASTVEALDGYYDNNMLTINAIEALTMDSGTSKSFLQLNLEALSIIETIDKNVQQFTAAADSFTAKYEGDQETLIGDTYAQTVKELDDLKMGFESTAASEVTSYKAVENLKLMKDFTLSNTTILSELSGPISTIRTDSLSTFNGFYQKSGLSEEALIQINNEILDGTSTSLTVGLVGNTLDETIHTSTLDDIQSVMEGYQRTMIFDYSGYSTYDTAEHEKQNTILDNLKTLLSSLDITAVFKEVSHLNKGSKPLPADKPSSHGLENVQGESVSGEVNYDYEENKTQAFEDAGPLSVLGSITENIKEQFLINEYTLGMFKSFVDGPEDLTFSRMSKGNHQMTTEVEYIITGIEDPDAALTNILLQILAIRIICNVIHLVVDGSKRTTIMNAANAVAGWWSFGMAAIIVAVLITLLWATAESVVDITTLIIEREKVPLVKFSNTWKTSLEGFMDTVVTTLTGMAIDTVGHMSEAFVEKMDETIEAVGGHLSDEVKNFYESEVNRLYSEGIQMAEGVVTEAETELFNAVDGYIEAYSGRSNPTFSLEDYIDPTSPYYELAVEMISDEAFVISPDMLYAELVLRRKALTDKFESKIEDKKEALLKTMGETVDETMTHYMDEVNGLIEVQVGQVTDSINGQISAISKDKIAGVSNKTSGTMSGNIAGNSGTDITDGGELSKTNKLAAFVPSLGYRDYLRLFMWLRYGELDERLLRMLDVMELNLAYHHLEVDGTPLEITKLSNYTVKFKAEAEFEIEQGLFLSPFLPYMNIDGFENKTFKREVVTRYE